MTARGLACFVALAALPARAQVPLPESGGPASEDIQTLEFVAGGGLVALTVDAAVAGEEPADATDSATVLRWVNGYGETAKLTVETVCPGQRFGLSVEVRVTSWGSGTVATPQPAVALEDGMLTTDLVRDIDSYAPGREGAGALVYRATATVADGTSAEHGDDYHTVTYTFLAQ